MLWLAFETVQGQDGQRRRCWWRSRPQQLRPRPRRRFRLQQLRRVLSRTRVTIAYDGPRRRPVCYWGHGDGIVMCFSGGWGWTLPFPELGPHEHVERVYDGL